VASFAGIFAIHATGSRAIAARAARSKHVSFPASDQTSRHSSGGGSSAAQPPDVDRTPMSKFHPPFTLTSAQRSMRAQLRAVHGAQHASATAVTIAAATARFVDRQCDASATTPTSGAKRIDCGRTSVAIPSVTPVATSHAYARIDKAPLDVRTDASRARDAKNAAITSSDAVTPSVMSAGVYARSAG
jgi:hypothetical protein